MANLKDIRTRIGSVRSTMQVTSAMKMVSAAKLKKAQNDVAKVRPFEQKLSEIIGFLGSSVSNVELDYPAFRRSAKGKTLIIAVASDKGLAGAFNANVVKEVERMINGNLAKDNAAGDVQVWSIGKQVAKGLRSRHIQAKVEEQTDFYDALNLDNIYRVADNAAKLFAAKEYKQVILVYNQFVNAAVQNVCQVQLLPLQMPEAAAASKTTYKDFIVEPSKEEVLADLVPQAIRTRFLAVVRESLASEHGARMTSMHKATDNAGELLGELQLQYNKARQTAITNELIEIVSGASALNG